MGKRGARSEHQVREGNWSEAIAVGSLSFVHIVKRELGFKAAHREVMELEGSYALREEGEAYGTNFGGETEVLRLESSRFCRKRGQEKGSSMELINTGDDLFDPISELFFLHHPGFYPAATPTDCRVTANTTNPSAKPCGVTH